MHFSWHKITLGLLYGHGRTGVVYTVITRSSNGVVLFGMDGPGRHAVDGRNETLSIDDAAASIVDGDWVRVQTSAMAARESRR